MFGSLFGSQRNFNDLEGVRARLGQSHDLAAILKASLLVHDA